MYCMKLHEIFMKFHCGKERGGESLASCSKLGDDADEGREDSSSTLLLWPSPGCLMSIMGPKNGRTRFPVYMDISKGEYDKFLLLAHTSSDTVSLCVHNTEMVMLSRQLIKIRRSLPSVSLSDFRQTGRQRERFDRLRLISNDT